MDEEPVPPGDTKVGKIPNPRIQLRQLRYFLAVAEELNFTRAADRMGIAQPPLSQQISNLERELSAELFVRTNRSVALTEAGRALMTHAYRLLNAAEQAALDVAEIAKGDGGLLKIGAIFSAIYTVIPQALRAFSEMRPNVTVRLAEMTISQQIEALRSGEIDAGILRGPILEPDLMAQSLISETFVAAIPADHPLALKSMISLSELASAPLIIISPSLSRLYSMKMTTALLERNYSLNIIQEVADMHTLLGLVGSGLGLSLVPASLQAIQLVHVVYRPIKEPMPTSTLQIVWRRDNQFRLLAAFTEATRSAVRSQGNSLLTGAAPVSAKKE